MTELYFFLISLLASVVGAICGIGGGVLIKPLLEAFGVMDVKAISFLSGCTVFTMSLYSFFVSRVKKESLVDLRTGTPLSIGAACGGILGKDIFQILTESFSLNRVGAVQAVCLMAVTLGTMLYTACKERIETRKIQNMGVCLLVGFTLGMLSAFLGIGGGPMNLAVLSFFFSAPTKTAAQSSLYIIMFSQGTSLLSLIFSSSVPEVSGFLLVLMVAGGLFGGFFGQRVNKRLNGAQVERLFMTLLLGIVLINIYNIWRYLR
ncbi:MAG: sulfite exporter TauE/SafE family protein [Lachnospiraceae bacterium]|jgi:uncharacterized membrane protein YfcA|nr:sulfite exporter TauE/SafE family protein [Lachnospiraceae bacterium]